jgi:UDP-glucose 6-dehydrogenase
MTYIRKTDRKHSTKDQVQRLLLDIRRLRDQDKTDSEVKEILGVGIRMYQDYMKRIREEDKIMWDTIIKHELESEILSVRGTMLYCVRYAKEQLKDKNTPSADKLEWINTLQGTRTNILKLLVEGPEYLRTAKQVYPPMIPSQIVVEEGEPAASTEEMRQSHENIKKRLARKKKEDV